MRKLLIACSVLIAGLATAQTSSTSESANAFVNEAGTAQNINIQITGPPQIESKGEAIVLAAESLDDTNSIDNPEKVIPQTFKIRII